MYETRFGLRHRPFRATPNTASYYPATGHERALAQVQQAVAEDEGLVLLTGGPGTGKTLLCQCLAERLGPDVTCAFLTNSHFRDCTGLFQALLYDLSQPYEGKGEQELRLAFTEFVLKNCAAGRRTVLLIDEAQHLTPYLLEELRLLGNLEARDSKAVQVVLAAQPRLEQTLRLPDLASFNQRLAVRTRLEPLDTQEAADYLVHHLRAAGGRPKKIISDEALETLARGARGVPRLLNQAAHQALVLAEAGEASLVDVEAALEALASLGLSDEGAGEPEAFAALQPAAEQEVEEEGVGAVPSVEEEDTPPEPDPGPPSGGRGSRLFVTPRRTA